MVPDPPLSIVGDQAESVYLKSYEEDDEQAKKVKPNTSLLYCNQKGYLLYYLVMRTYRYVPLLQADMTFWIDAFLHLNKATASGLIVCIL